VSTATAEIQDTNPLVVLADKIERKPHLVAFLQNLRQENKTLSPEEAIKYAVCKNSPEIALALRRYRENVRMIMIGPGLQGNVWTLARMLCKRVHVVMVLEPSVLHNPLYAKIIENLQSLGIVISMVNSATEVFFKPLIKDYVLSGLTAGNELRDMSPEERSAVIERRLEAVDKFPSLPDTQRRVAELDDMDSPKKWAAAIDPDVLTRTVILRMLNSAYYGFRSRVNTIEQAVALASARTIREIVLACQIRQLFEKTSEKTIDQFWRHSLAVGFFAKLFTMPADQNLQTPAQKIEFSRFRLEEEQVRLLLKARLWEKLELGPKEDAFTPGMLHDIGLITMLLCLEDSLELVMALINAEFKEAQEAGKLWAHSEEEIERFLMGDIDHQVIGYRLAKRWELDEKVCDVIGFHHEIQENSSNLLKIIGLADLAAGALFPYPATEEQHPLPLLFERVAGIAKKRPGKTQEEGIYNAICSAEVLGDLEEVVNRLGAPKWLWEIVDFKDFFHLCYMIVPRMREVTIRFLQQTATTSS